MIEEKRANPRFEPSSVTISITPFGEANAISHGYLLDISSGGLAIDLPQKSILPAVGSTVEVKVKSEDLDDDWMSLGRAKVLRTWMQSTYFDNGKGVAFSFDAPLKDSRSQQILLHGTQQHTRLQAQARLAMQDIEHLSAYRRCLVECQIKLYTVTLTLSTSLVAAYFALNYYGIASGMQSQPSMSFWRTMIAALPGALSIACALMVSQKSASIQRTDAYLAVLKDCSVRNQYPREYRGWEWESRKLRHVMKTTACNDCEVKRKCGTLRAIDQTILDSRRLLINPSIDLYYSIVFLTFYIILFISTIAVLIELSKFQWGITAYMVTSSLITVLMLLATIAIFYLTVQLRRGHLSFDYYKRCWLDILHRCRKGI